MCDGCKNLSTPCLECREFMEWAHAQRSRIDSLVEEVARLRVDVDEMRGQARRREESERAEQAIREYGE